MPDSRLWATRGHGEPAGADPRMPSSRKPLPEPPVKELQCSRLQLMD